MDKKTQQGDWIRALFLVALVFFAYWLVQSTGWINGINIQSQKITLGVALLVGLVASFSSCLAVVGSIVVAFGEKFDIGDKNFFKGVVRPNLFFHIGRVGTFFALGGLLGALGVTINLSGQFVSAYTIGIAIVMAWLGLNILGVLPSISALGLRPPKFITKTWARAEKSQRGSAPFLLGGITFFLPCGFTQTMQILALASGSFWSGAMILTAFSLGTAPVLFLLGLSASWGRAKNLGFIQKAAGILVLFFAVFTAQSGLALKNVKTNVITSDSAKSNDQSSERTPESAPGNFQTVEMHVTNSGFEPSVFTVKAGTPIHWVIKGDQVSGCTSRIIVPSYGISKSIGSGDNEVDFMPSGKGQISFSCGMGMVRGKFLVE
jgi:uncharacterized protein